MKITRQALEALSTERLMELYSVVRPDSSVAVEQEEAIDVVLKHGFDPAYNISLEEIIMFQGWNDETLIRLLYEFIDANGTMDALSEFLGQKADEENEA